MKTKTRNRMVLMRFIPVLLTAAMMFQCAGDADEASIIDPNSPELTDFSEENAPFETSYDADSLMLAELDEIVELSEVEPTFVGGSVAMNKYIVENVNYPKEAMDSNIEGTVYVGFVIDSNGKLRKPEIRKGVHKSIDKEALRVIAGMPDWIPGENDGKNVAVKFTLPIRFSLE